MPAAFPGAAGWGAGATGGRGGTVLQVTNLNDSGAGSFRVAAEQSGTRIVVPMVAGEIDNLSNITINDPNITIAMQAAPGNGIYFTGRPIRIQTHNWIIRYLKHRGNGQNNSIAIRPFSGPVYDGILDHCSTSWNGDDGMDIWHEGDVGEYEGNELYNITIQNHLFAESEGINGKFAIVRGDPDNNGETLVHHISFLSNLFAGGNYRMPFMASQHSEIINNLTYNSKWYQIGFGDEAEVDIVNNYAKTGPLGAGLRFNRDNFAGDELVTSIYLDGNVLEGTLAVDEDNWPHVLNEHAPGGIPSEETHRRLTRLSQPTYPYNEVTAAVTYTRVLEEAGACRRLNSDGTWEWTRDTLDSRLVAEVEAGTGISSLIADASAETPPTVIPGTAYTDTDGDGMPDEYEDLNGLDKNDDSDQNSTSPNGRTNIENFLSGIQLVEHGGPRGL